jgi:site-specific recombinase XerD
LPDLFAAFATDWAINPRKAFDGWLAARNFRGSSAEVYRAQWHHFLDWLAERNKTLLTTEPALIQEFVATLDVKRQQRARYLRIMERVFDDMAKEAPAAGNPARPVSRSTDSAWTDARSNAPTGFLSEMETAQIWRELERAIPLPAGTSGGVPAAAGAIAVAPVATLPQDTTPAHGPVPATPDSPPLPLHWRDLRDRALAAVMLGAGLKLSEAEALTIRCITFDAPLHASAPAAGSQGADTLLIEGSDPRFHRRTPIDTRTKTILQSWLTARREADVPGDLVFPAGRGGRPMHKATALRAIDTLVEQAGPMPRRTARISPQTLRNAYAANLIEAGADDDLLMERLGFAQILSAKRLRAAWSDWQRASAHAQTVYDAVLKAIAPSGKPE